MIKNKKGFTLIELLIVAAVIAVIQVVVIYTYLNAQKQQRDVQRKSDINKIATAVELYHTDKKTYPETSLWISSQYASSSDTLANTILKNKYIDVIPCDPKVSEWNCSQGGHNTGSNPDFGYIYITEDYNFSGSYTGDYPGKNKYAIFSTLEAPNADDQNVMNNLNPYEKAFRDYVNSKYHLSIMYKVGN